MQIYDYFTENDFCYNVENMNELTPEMLSKVCVMQLSVPGAMGMGGIVLMFTEDGNVIRASFLAVKHKSKVTMIGTTKMYDYLNKFFQIKKFVNSDGSSKVINGWKGIYTEFGWYIIGKEDIVNQMIQDAEESCRNAGSDTRYSLHHLNLAFPTYAKKALNTQ